jgi:hypothetical protein
MAVIEDPSGASQAKVDAGAFRAGLNARGVGYSTSVTTGTIAAALAANSAVFAMRLNPGSGTTLAEVDRIRLKFTTLLAFTTAITGGRGLALYRGAGATTAGGTGVAAATRKNSTAAASQFDTANGGDIRVATTAALTVTGVTFEANPFRSVSLAHAGGLGGFADFTWEFHDAECYPIILQPGQLLAVRNPAAMDAVGTWQLQVDVDWRETTAR